MGRRSVREAGPGPRRPSGSAVAARSTPPPASSADPLHLPGWIDIPIVAMAPEEFGVPAVLENDATAAMLAEHRYGAARGADNALYLTVSTGSAAERSSTADCTAAPPETAGNSGTSWCAPAAALHLRAARLPGGVRLGHLDRGACPELLADGGPRIDPARTCRGCPPSTSSAAAPAGDPLARGAVGGDHRRDRTGRHRLVNMFEPKW